MIRIKGWIVPNYSLPPNEDNVEILRVVVRESLSRDMVDQLVGDIIEATEKLMKVESEVNARVFEPLEPSSDRRKREAKGEGSKDEDITKPRTYARPC